MDFKTKEQLETLDLGDLCQDYYDAVHGTKRKSKEAKAYAELVREELKTRVPNEQDLIALNHIFYHFVKGVERQLLGY
jgi:hypothetical protein